MTRLRNPQSAFLGEELDGLHLFLCVALDGLHPFLGVAFVAFDAAQWCVSRV